MRKTDKGQGRSSRRAPAPRIAPNADALGSVSITYTLATPERRHAWKRVWDVIFGEPETPPASERCHKVSEKHGAQGQQTPMGEP